MCYSCALLQSYNDLRTWDEHETGAHHQITNHMVEQGGGRISTKAIQPKYTEIY